MLGANSSWTRWTSGCLRPHLSPFLGVIISYVYWVRLIDLQGALLSCQLFSNDQDVSMDVRRRPKAYLSWAGLVWKLGALACSCSGERQKC